MMCTKARKTQIISEEGPKAVGPYSLGMGVTPQPMIFLSAQLPINQAGELVGETIKKQTVQVIENIENLLEEAGSSLDSVVKTTIYLSNMDDFDAMNQVYAIYFSHPYPARSCVGVSALPKGAMVQIDCIASALQLSSNDDVEECENCDE